MDSNPPGSGLLRYRSAPSSLFTNFTDIGGFEISRFVKESDSPSFDEFEDKSPTVTATESGGYSGLPPHYPRQYSVTSSYGLVDAIPIEAHAPLKKANSNLMRQNSSPEGIFSNSSAHNGYGAMRGELSPSTDRLKSRIPSSLGIGNGNGDFTFSSWNDSSRCLENFSGLKRDEGEEGKLFPGIQNGERGNQIHLLSHHLSLPKSSAEMVAVEKFMQFPDSVPCKIRAKRGCATHPRSIAERVRRTRISERMRKLQELVPNMEKQTNTADMLDLAVEYIKDLQKQFKTLNENRANCKCLNSS